MDLISFADVAAALSAVADPTVVFFVFAGAVIGMIFGAAPGLTAASAIALFLPMTYAMGLTTSMALLLGIYCSGYFAGSIPAILINTPGTPGSAATALDGHQMALKGESDRAITTALVSSFLGGLFSLLLLTTIAPSLAKVALTFTSVEYFSFALVGIVCVAGISRGSMVKGLASACIGILVSTVGLDPVSGVGRFIFDEPNLMGGISSTAALIGLFAIGQMLLLAKKNNVAAEFLPVQARSSVLSVIGDHWRNRWIALRSAIIGTMIGVLPGTGPAIASWVSYSDALRTARRGDRFGQGEVKGVIACEVSNNAVTGGALVPLLTLGIPGDPVTAILIGALLIQGIEAGPFLIKHNPSLFVSILILLFMSNCFMVALGLCCRRLAAKVLEIPAGIMVATICTAAAAGSFSLQSNAFDVKLVMAFGLLGYLMIRYRFPTAPAVLGIVLGPILEQNLRNALTGNGMDFTVFFTRPISAGALLVMCFLLYVWLKPAGGRGGAKADARAEETVNP
ncbi:tripartite tricarboxylate transporter permease [Propylenella binzhouense]|uniref:C4-dicarboxylate ABC transporter permease n=1 Tax=Propylenella binzhouense TaxID=2555902 RepID=A0A964T2L3_9HYPH|nr:tripartite tricarboxylate transporter permease [Propylenella binzhouense]MYZ47263.1 C4-dicarboxylate ABC transporter permease [Propylenella binzhouense]